MWKKNKNPNLNKFHLLITSKEDYLMLIWKLRNKNKGKPININKNLKSKCNKIDKENLSKKEKFNRKKQNGRDNFIKKLK